MNMKKAKKKKKKIEKHKGNRAWTIFTNWDQQTFSSLSPPLPRLSSNNRMTINASKTGGQGRKGVEWSCRHTRRGVSFQGEHATRLAATRQRHLFLGGRGSDHLLPLQQLCERENARHGVQKCGLLIWISEEKERKRGRERKRQTRTGEDRPRL